MITSWDIYWVMQMDSIGIGAGLGAFMGLVASALLWAYALDEPNRGAAVLAALTSLLTVTLFAVAVFLPTTKTAAAMVVLPAIVNNEEVKGEARELYDLAKSALQKAVKDEEKAP